MPHAITKEVYTFDELSDSAKEVAREWYRNGALDYDWYDSVYDDCATIFTLLGVTSQKPVKLMGGGTRYDPCIWFSGFSSQGDGACFEGSYAYAKGSAKAVHDHCGGTDVELCRIARELAAVQRRNSYRATASLVHRGRDYHERCVDIDVDDATGEDGDTIAELLRDLMSWIYRQLESAHDYLLSDESVDESIVANEYEFDEDGNRI